MKQGPITHRRTKIVATVGPGSDSEDMLNRLIGAGVDVFRLNFSHGASSHHAEVAARIRRQAGYAVLGGVKVGLDRPRVRDRDGHEVPLHSYARFRSPPRRRRNTTR